VTWCRTSRSSSPSGGFRIGPPVRR
jgi:hypothetical protein